MKAKIVEVVKAKPRPITPERVGLILTKEEMKWLEGSVYIAILQMDVMIEEMGSMGWERKHLTFLQKLRKKLNKSLVAQEIIGE